jgi:DNA repair protein RadC
MGDLINDRGPASFLKSDQELTVAPAASVAARIQDMHSDEKPREKLSARGARSLSDAELLAIFFRTGRQGMNAIDMARELIKKFGSLQAMARQDLSAYQEVSGIGPVKAIELAAVFEMAARVAREEFRTRPIVTPQEVYDLLGAEMRGFTKEVLRVILLDARSHLIKVEDVSMGTLDETIAHPRDILKPVIIHNAHSFVLVHNHPSGDPTPSSADRQITRRIVEAAQLMRLKFMDHIIVGHPRENREPYFSFREMGLV